MLVFNETMRRSAVVAILAAGLAACSEGPTAPPTSGFDPSSALMSRGGNGNGGSGNADIPDLSGHGNNSGSRTFTIWPLLPVYEKFGDHILSMPASVVCDPATSGYGAAYWDEPCQRARRPIKVTATWATRGGRPVISFSPDLRFAPSNIEQKWVTLSLRDTKGFSPELYYTILWFDREAGRWVDESQTDATLKAYSEAGNLVTRRLKHFSDWALWVGLGSYNVTSGLGGDMTGWGGW